MVITGVVRGIAGISPQKVDLRGEVGKKINTTVSIIPWEKYPFRIIDVKAEGGENIRCSLEEVKESEKLEYKLTVENLKNVHGYYSDTIILKTDSEIRPELKLRVTGNITAENIAVIRPEKVMLQGPAGDPIKTSVSIVPEKKYLFKILEAKAKVGKDIACRLEKAESKEGNKYLLIVENLKKERGRYSDTIILKTDSKVRPEINISVSGVITAEETITVIPKEVNLYGYAGEHITASVSIAMKKGHPFKTIEAKAKKGENISCKLEKTVSPHDYVYILTIENLKKEKGNYEDTIVLKTDNKAILIQNIPVSGMIFGSDQKVLHDMLKNLVDQPNRGVQGVPGR